MSTLQPVHVEDLSLVASIVSGEEAAADEFARKFSERFEWLARRKGVPAQDCQDVAQEAMLAALSQMQRGLFRGESKLGSWLEHILIGKISDYWRRQRSRAALPMDEPGELHDFVETIPEPISDYELVIHVCETLMTLPGQHRVILLLKRNQEFTLEEISHMLELTLAQVSGKLYAAEEMFRERFCGGQPPSQQPPDRLALAGGVNSRRRTRGQSTNHRPTKELRRAGDQSFADGLLLWASKRIGTAIGRSACAGV
ncbi:MAG: sigma-70 family RNA polymerase sigma factor [Acidobacteria bacterium]|nr:sigma-70 family RNA polymerase sigma factor [Acidobacteriota bacterium]